MLSKLAPLCFALLHGILRALYDVELECKQLSIPSVTERLHRPHFARIYDIVSLVFKDATVAILTTLYAHKSDIVAPGGDTITLLYHLFRFLASLFEGFSSSVIADQRHKKQPFIALSDAESEMAGVMYNLFWATKWKLEVKNMVARCFDDDVDPLTVVLPELVVMLSICIFEEHDQC
jgi:hypothetical protein